MTALTRSKDPLVWIDCEMTGLDPETDRILSLCCLVTDSDLNILDPKGFEAIIHTPKEILDRMSDWCIQTHTQTGLMAACQIPPTTLTTPPTTKTTTATTTTAPQAAQGLLNYIQTLTPPRTALLAGNSIHMDRAFLSRPPWSPILAHLHYRVLDVSAVKEAVRRWAPAAVLARVPVKRLRHTAVDDVRESLEEARFYMRWFAGDCREGGGAGGEDGDDGEGEG